MLVYRCWQIRKGYGNRWDCDGWFLFGLIPVYIRKVQVI